jgi:hypothetical protein
MQRIEGLSDMLLVIDLAFRPRADEEAHMALEGLRRRIGRPEFAGNGGNGRGRQTHLKEPHDKGAARQLSGQMSIGKRTDLPMNSLIHDLFPSLFSAARMTDYVSRKLMYRS